VLDPMTGAFRLRPNLSEGDLTVCNETIPGSTSFGLTLCSSLGSRLELNQNV
jgi:hypothetical protein